ncbi:MAG: hypothetical protein DRJ13_12940 [Bacteroidetes bacterium]|nr:MAG: hypothetical protein DRJ13_12940 [Bacteroidota bacterium]
MVLNMKSITLNIQPTVEAIRDQSILEKNGIRAVVIPHYKAPSFYVGDNQISELLVMDHQEQEAREILGLPDEPPEFTG